MAARKRASPTKALEPAELNGLLARANGGDRSALATVRHEFDAHPELWREAGDLAAQIQNQLVQALGGDSEITKDAVQRRLTSLRQELLGDAPGALERLLVERILVCWLQAHEADARAYLRKGSLPLTHADYLHRRLDRAQRRYLAAIRALAVVRRLQLPAVQVNIADRQVNVAGGAAPP